MNLEKRIDDLISKMTLEEKIGQLNQISSAGEVGKLKELIKKGKVGSLIMASTCFAGSDEGGIAGVEYFKELQRIAELFRSLNHCHYSLTPSKTLIVLSILLTFSPPSTVATTTVSAPSISE